MDSEDSTSVSTVRANLLSEAGRDSGVADGKCGFRDPFIAVEGGDRLLRSGDQIFLLNILVFGLLTAFADNFVQLIVKLRQLSDVLHHFLPHEERSAHRFVALLQQQPQGQLNQSLFSKTKLDFNVIRQII